MRVVSGSLVVLLGGLVGSTTAHAGVRVEEISITGPMTRPKVQRGIRSQRQRMVACLPDTPDSARKPAEMRFRAQWVVLPSGHTAEVAVKPIGSTGASARVAACLATQLRGWVFPTQTDGSAQTHVSCQIRLRVQRSTATPTEAWGRGVGGLGDVTGGRCSGKGAVLHGMGGGVGVLGTRGAGTSARTRGGTYTPRPDREPVATAESGDRKAASRLTRRKSPRPAIRMATPVVMPARPGPPGSASPVASAETVAPDIRAGRHDDNKQYSRFLSYLTEQQADVVYPVDVSERLFLQVNDRDGKSLPNCGWEIKNLVGDVRAHGTTFADGRSLFFPADGAPAQESNFVATVACGVHVRTGQIDRAGPRTATVQFDMEREVPRRAPLDIAIVIDTTGSMGGQIARLKQTLQAIHLQLMQLPTNPDVRFALVAYRDRGDNYVTRVTPFTNDVEAFRKQLNRLQADGGGDTPEDLQSALRDALHELQWRAEAVRLGFVIADATFHTNYGQTFTYRSAMRESLERGIKWSMVGAAGLTPNGEVLFRQIAQYTMGEYVFITAGDSGDSDGSSVSASHHVGSNYRRENLDQAIVRIVRRELSYLGDHPRDFDDTIVASGGSDVPREQVLSEAVTEAVRQLADYSALRLPPKTPVAILPVSSGQTFQASMAEYLTDQLVLSATRLPDFRVVDRDIDGVLQEHALQLSDLFDVEQTVPVGRLVGAEVLITAKLTTAAGEPYLYAKMVRVETGEILSAAQVHLSQINLASAR